MKKPPKKPRATKRTPYPYERATKAQRKIGTLWTWIHHEVPLEILYEPIENRVQCTRQQKPEHERETRLQAMRPFTGTLPEPVEKAYAAWVTADAAWWKAHAAWVKADAARVKAHAAWVKADVARVKAYAARVKAHAAWVKTLADHRPAMEAAVRKCGPDVVWDDKGLVFPKAQEAR